MNPSINLNICTNIEKAIKVNKAFIYLKKNIASFEGIPIDNLFGAIEDIGEKTLFKSGIPNELIAYKDLSFEAPKITYTKDDIIAYYSPFESDTVEHVMTIVKLFNQLSSINISIYTSHKIQKYVKEFSNSNIYFIGYDSPEELSIKANKIITYGYSARSFIKQKIPTIIIGPYGLGGWVTPDNIKYLLKDNFKGRPCGRFNEFIPLNILVDEFMEISEEKKLKKILKKNVSIVNKYVETFWENNEEKNFIHKQDKLYACYVDKEKRWNLKPKLASNTYIVKEKETTVIQRREINDILFSLPESDLEFIEDLKSNLSCKELQLKYGMNEDEFWEIITPLWKRKAIIF